VENLKHIKKFIVNIDGSSGSGKSTAARLLGKKYNWSVLYSGLLFRYAAKKIIEKKPNNKIKFLEKLFKKLKYNKITNLNLHTPEISKYSAEIAKVLKIRLIIKLFQKKYVERKKRVVLEGRDMSKIFPKAEVKFFVECTPLIVAAKRRWLQLKIKNKKISLNEVAKDLKKRDFIDKNRKHSKLERHAESVYINTAKLNIKSVLDKMSKHVDKKLRKKYGK
tara:strand:- start:31 stop:693 length:663 start_codon:yes stop_codon:yes gene_type:complete